MTEERYRHEYINNEISSIIDTYTNNELTAEEITDRLNYEYRMHEKFKKESEHFEKREKICYDGLGAEIKDLKEYNEELLEENHYLIKVIKKEFPKDLSDKILEKIR